jgi:hypothetical protein
MQLEISYWARVLQRRDISDDVLRRAGIEIGERETAAAGAD